MSLPLPPFSPEDIRRVAFLGSPGIAVPTLDALHEAGYEIPLVVSGVDKRRGRGGKTSPTAVKARAIELGLSVSSDVDDLLALHAQDPIHLAVVVAFGKLIRPHVLAEIPMVNIHFSPLPRWRGAAPVERAILEGDAATAIAIMSVVEGLDEGDIWAVEPVPITDDDTLISLWQSMANAGARLLIDTMRAGFAEASPQLGEPVYAHKLTPDDRRLDWSKSAAELHRVVRVGDAWTELAGERFKIHEAAVVDSASAPGVIQDLVVGTGDGGLQLIVVQPANRARMDAESWANGAQPDGLTFDSP